MAEETPAKTRKPRSDKGKPRKARVSAPAILFAAEPEAPIHVRLRLKNYPVPVEFGCAQHTVENGFHVFMYPSERDRYRTTRREFAISEIIEVEITEARRGFNTCAEPAPETIAAIGPAPQPALVQRGPVLHSVKKNAGSILSQLETSSGPIKMDQPPLVSFGNSEG